MKGGGRKRMIRTRGLGEGDDGKEIKRKKKEGWEYRDWLIEKDDEKFEILFK